MKLPVASCRVLKRNSAEANPPLRRDIAPLRRDVGSLLVSYGAVHLAIHLWSKLQDILAKANKRDQH